MRYFYPRSPCGERLLTEINKMATGQISIHALLAESDFEPQHEHYNPGYFYPRSPCGERPALWRLPGKGRLFLSTLSLRRATTSSTHSDTKNWYFYPRSPCGERRILGRRLRYGKQFLSTLSLRRATGPDCQGAGPCQNFYPRSPCGERPGLGGLKQRRIDISIHALLAESDGYAGVVHHNKPRFLSTLSLRRAT